MPYAIKITPQYYADTIYAPEKDWLAQGEVNEMNKCKKDHNYMRMEKYTHDYDFGPAYFDTLEDAEKAMNEMAPRPESEYFLSYGEYARPVWNVVKVRAPVNVA